jgi:hypothetical protein
MSTSASPETRNGAHSRRRRNIWIVVVIAVLAILAAAAYWYFNLGPGRPSPAGSLVAEFEGTGNTTTDPFTVRSGWRIDWENSGDLFSFAITGDRDFGTVVEQTEPGSGSTSPTGAGTFQLNVTAQGSWRIQVFQGD